MDNISRFFRQLMPRLMNNRGEVAPAAEPAPAPEPATATWKSNLGTDISGSPLLAKFEDTAEGLNKAFESHANLEQLLGHEKVPIPQGPEDVEGWNRFSKAMGIPDVAEGYGLADATIPDSMKGMTIDKNKFAEIVHAHKLTPAQAKGCWEAYTQSGIEAYGQFENAQKEQMETTINTLRGKWGDTYDTNVELGQAVINQFSNDQDMNDYLTAVLTKDAKGIEFLSKIGSQFAENKIGNFQMKRFSLAPEEAQAEIDKTKMDLNGPYMNQGGKFTEKEHVAAVDRVNHLMAVVAKGTQQAA